MSKRKDDEHSEERMRAKRTQMIAAIIIGLVVGGVLWWLTEFWMWLPAGAAVGLATGAIMKPPTR